jgi:hypothetical protein
MVAEFYLKSYLLHEDDRHFLAMLTDAGRQGATLCFYSDGYLAKEVRLRSRWGVLKRAWNRLAGRVNPWLMHSLGENERGMAVVKTYWLPAFTLPDVELTRFADEVRKSQADGVTPSDG